jgi:hypothetical protein
MGFKQNWILGITEISKMCFFGPLRLTLWDQHRNSGTCYKHSWRDSRVLKTMAKLSRKNGKTLSTTTGITCWPMSKMTLKRLSPSSYSQE